MLIETQDLNTTIATMVMIRLLTEKLKAVMSLIIMDFNMKVITEEQLEQVVEVLEYFWPSDGKGRNLQEQALITLRNLPEIDEVVKRLQEENTKLYGWLNMHSIKERGE